MKTELVNLVTNDGTETRVLLTTELDELDSRQPSVSEPSHSRSG
jgi:hypothetical protein